MADRGVPVVMYHSVGPLLTDWAANYLTTPVEAFEDQMQALADEGWTAIPLRRLYEHMAEGADLPPKPVVLTFDDGYLDNWVYMYPIIKKFGHRAVIWMTTDFVDPPAEARPTLEDVWEGKVEAGDLCGHGYLSWEEMRTMTMSGLVEIQSHATTHTWYPKGPCVLDFHRPSGVDGYAAPPWLAWNLFPQRKYESLTGHLEDVVPYGTPIYENGKSLETHRYFDDPALTRLLVETVEQGGGAAFFGRKGWKDDLYRAVAGYGDRKDRFESDAEYESRVRFELAESKRLIEANVGAPVDFLCWPGGARNRTTMRISSDVGYVATTTHYEDPDRRNTRGQNPAEINRIGCASPWVWGGRVIIRRTEPAFFIEALEIFAGCRKSLWTLRRHKLKYLLRHYLTGKT